MLVFLAWVCSSKPKIHIRPATPVLRPSRYREDRVVELSPLPRAFMPAPLYENHKCDAWVPNNMELEKYADGYFYPKTTGGNKNSEPLP